MTNGSDTLRLRVTAGVAQGKELEVVDELIIGRGAEGDGKLEGDVELSRQHARIARGAAGGFELEDLGSTNGTLLNGFKVQRPEPLRPGDRVELGGTTLVVQVSAPTAPAAQPVAEEPVAAEEPAAPAEEPTAPAEPAAVDQPPARVSLRLEIDLAAREARLALDEGSDEVKLVNRDGRWEIVTDG